LTCFIAHVDMPSHDYSRGWYADFYHYLGTLDSAFQHLTTLAREAHP